MAIQVSLPNVDAGTGNVHHITGYAAHKAESNHNLTCSGETIRQHTRMRLI